jgi:uncharacterized protein (DUF1778 family)
MARAEQVIEEMKRIAQSAHLSALFVQFLSDRLREGQELNEKSR